MTTAPTRAIAVAASAGRRRPVLPSFPSPGTMALIARRELRDTLSNKWFLLSTAGFAALASALSFVSLAGAGASGFAGFGRTAAGLLNLIMLIVPLMALTAGASSLAAERERGMLTYLLSQPLGRAELLLGKFVGLALALAGSLALGFGLSAALLAWRAGGDGASAFLVLVGGSCLLALGMLSVGMLISVFSRRAAAATGTAVFAWLVLAFASDLGLMAGTLTFKLRAERLFALATANPLQSFKMLVLRELNASLDVLGPAGLYAEQQHGAALGPILLGVLAAWCVVPLVLALVLFLRRQTP